jgi:hypothetical protein
LKKKINSLLKEFLKYNRTQIKIRVYLMMDVRYWIELFWLDKKYTIVAVIEIGDFYVNTIYY